MNKKTILIVILALLSCAPAAFPQDDADATDSLRSLLDKATSQSEKADIYLQISRETINPDTAIKYAQYALKAQTGLGISKMATCYMSQGWGYYMKNDFRQSLENFRRAASMFIMSDLLSEASMTYTNMASCNRQLHNFKDMWDDLYRALETARKAADTANICYALSEIADVYITQRMEASARETLTQALEYATKTGNYAEMGSYAKQLGGIGNTEIENIKKSLRWSLKAEEYFNKAESTDEFYKTIQYNNYAQIIYCYLNLAKFYHDDRYIDSTKTYIQLYDDYTDSPSASINDKIVGMHIHARQLMYDHKYRQAITLLQQCLSTSQNANSPIHNEITYALLHESYENTGDYQKALHYLDRQLETEATASGSEAIAQAVAYNAREKIEQEKRDIENENLTAQERKEEQERQKKRTRAIIAAIIFAVVAIIIIMLVSWLATRRAVQKIALSNVTIMRQQIMIDDQKQELQESSSKIKQSMAYARRIQMAATSTKDELQQLFPECLAIYSPHGIVSGDWYWAKQLDKQRIIAVGGCSEHGVPGAMVSMLIVDALKETISKTGTDRIASPAEIIVQLDLKIRNSIGADVEVGVSLCIIDDPAQTTTQAKFSSINNDITTVHDGKATLHTYRKHEDTLIQLHTGDYLLLYSKNTYRQILAAGEDPMEVSEHLAGMTTENQEATIDNMLKKYQQTSDLVAVGIRI